MIKLMIFEFYKSFKNKSLLFVFLLYVFCLTLYGFFYIHTNSDFVQEQKLEAKIMINKIDNYSYQELDEIKQQRNYYYEILNTNTWKDIYIILNKLDQLYLNYPNIVSKNKSDLNYDEKTNIEYRKYCIEKNIDPNEKSGYLYLNYLMRYRADIFIFTFMIFIALLLYYEENDNGDAYFLYSLSYTYSKIIISKFIVTIIMSLIAILIPLLCSFIMSILLYNLGNENILVKASEIYANIILNQSGFVCISDYSREILTSIVFDILFVNSVVCYVKTIFSSRYYVFVCVICILFWLYLCGFNIFISYSVSSHIPSITQGLFAIIMSAICVLMTVINLRVFEIKK